MPGALWHAEIGPIDLVWGDPGSGRNSGFGLAKILLRHPEMIDRLPDVLPTLPIIKRPQETGNNRWVLEDATYRAIVAPDFAGIAKRWLITAFLKKPPESPDISPRASLPDGGSTGAGDGDHIGERTDFVDPTGKPG